MGGQITKGLRKILRYLNEREEWDNMIAKTRYSHVFFDDGDGYRQIQEEDSPKL